MLGRRFLALAALLLAASTAGGDEIDRIEGETLAQIPKSSDSKPLARLTVAEIAGLPSVLHDSRAALLVATTDRGEITFVDVRPTIEAIRAGGVATIRLAPADPSP